VSLPEESSRPSLLASARAAAAPFVVARALVVGALVLARFLADQLRPTGAVGARAIGTAHAGLLSWDAAWYRRIAEVGYARAGTPSLRFYPLLPLLARAVALMPGVSDGAALIVIANVSAFAALVLLHRLVSRERLGTDVAERSVWTLSLWPAGFVLAMGYSEALLLLLSIAAFLAWRQERWWWGVLPAYLAGTARPVGVLLAVPALAEAVRWWRTGGGRSAAAVLARVVAIAAAPAGALTYLAWSAATGHGFLEPLSIQLGGTHRAGFGDPFATLAHDTGDLLGGHHFGTALHAPFAVLFVLLTVYLLFRLPAAYGWYAVATMVVALTARNLDGLERYALACFPLAVGAACLTRPRWAERTLLTGLAAAVTVFALLAFLGLYVA
jgi:hypothetical protein